MKPFSKKKCLWFLQQFNNLLASLSSHVRLTKTLPQIRTFHLPHNPIACRDQLLVLDLLKMLGKRKKIFSGLYNDLPWYKVKKNSPSTNPRSFQGPGSHPKRRNLTSLGFLEDVERYAISSSPLNLAVMRKCGYLCHLQENWLLESFRHKDIMRKHHAPNSCLKPERKSSTSTLCPKGCRQQFFGGILDPPMMIHGT